MLVTSDSEHHQGRRPELLLPSNHPDLKPPLTVLTNTEVGGAHYKTWWVRVVLPLVKVEVMLWME